MSERATTARETPAPAERTCSTCGGSYPGDFSVCPRDATPLADDDHGAKDPLIGTVLAGTYRIVKVLGEGGMARLYEAEHLRLDTRYAVKVIHRDMAASPELLVRFEREARASARIRSEHVVRVIDVLRAPDGRPCIVAELLEGEDLQAHLDRVGRLPIGEAIPIARQVCRALAAAHDCGVIHRDLKPSNVFLCRSAGRPVVKVVDFGVAKLVDEAELTKTGAIVGTLAYMAPEQAKRAADAGPLADIYTVGAVLYRMVTGEPPYGKDPAVNPLILLLNGEPERPRAVEPSVPEGVEAVIQRAMARDPSARPTTAEALDSELALFDTGTGGRPATSSPARRGRRATAERIALTARRARPSAAALAVGSIVAVGLYTAAFVNSVLDTRVRTGSERALIAIIAAVAAIAFGAYIGRALKHRWRSAPAVRQLAATIGRGLAAGVVTFGALALLGEGIGAMVREPWAWLGLGTARLVLVGVAAGVAVFGPFGRRTPE